MHGGVVWLDVSDLLLWRRAEVTGIQRVLAEVVAETVRRPPAGATVRFLTLDATLGPRPLSAGEVMPSVAALLRLPWPPSPRLTLPHRVARWLLHRLPERLREPARNRVYGWLAAARRRLRRRPARRRAAVAAGAQAVPPPPPGPRAGDTLLNLGTPWSHHPGYLERLAREKRRLGLRYAQLVYDVGPAWRADEPGMPRLFADWLRAMLPLADQLLTISRYSAEDLRRLAVRQDLDLPPLRRVRLGVGLPRVAAPPRRADLASTLLRGGYLLTVGSLSPSKNHAAVVMALLAERGRALPRLLWIGRTTQRAALDALLAQHPRVAAQVLHLEGVDDHDLALAYAHCRLTIFPSFFEGFGLPVAESLAFGKVCLASNACSIPEAGGDCADYFAPDDPAALAALIERYLDDSDLAAREAEIRQGHRPTTWQETCRQLYAALEPG